MLARWFSRSASSSDRPLALDRRRLKRRIAMTRARIVAEDAFEELRSWWELVWHQDRLQREFVTSTLRAALARVVPSRSEAPRRRRLD